MRRAGLAVVAIALLTFGGATAGAGTAPRPPAPSAEYIVGFRASVPAAARPAIAAAASARVLPARLGPIHAELVATDAAGARALAAQPGVRYVERNPVYHTDALPSSPNDPLFGQLWAMQNTGQSVNGDTGTPGDDIGAVEAWRHGTGSRSVIVADVDSGMDTSHPDLAPNLWINPGENCSGCRNDGIDNDGNGYVDDWQGWDFVQNDNVPQDVAKHGTHTAGTIGAAGDNGLGVIGVSPTVSLMPLRFIGNDGTGTGAAADQAILYAVQNGARVINSSWGGGEYDPAMTDAISYADAHGVLFVASAGNSGNDAAFYPAATDLPNVISTAATDQNDGLAYFSTFGDTVDLAAPGVDILSTWPGGGYFYADGTSMAAPQVTGAAALLLSQHPDATPETIKALLFATVKPLASLAGKVLTGGRLDLGAAADCTAAPDVWIDAPRQGFVVAPGHPVTVRVLAGECASPSGVSVSAGVDGTPVTLTTTGNGLYTGSFMPVAPGPITLQASAGDGASTATRTTTGRAVTELPLDGAAHTVSAAAGSDALVTFSESAGHRVSLELGSGTLGAVSVTITAPDGTRSLENWPIGSTGGFIDPRQAWLDGVYWVRLHPTGGGGGWLPLSLWDVPADLAGPITPDGSPLVATLPVPGQRAVWTFPDTAGGRISLRIASDTITSTRLQIKRPDGKGLATLSNVTTAGAYIDARSLPLTGTYSVVIDPVADASGRLTVSLWDVPPDLTGMLTVGGAATVAALQVPGQNARYTFSGTAGRHVTLHVTADAIAGAKISILRDDGTTLAGPKWIGLAGGTLAATLPSTGSYSVVVNPVTYRTGQASVSLSSP